MAKKTWMGVQSRGSAADERQPDRDRRHRLQQLDQALDHLVGLAADIARDAAQHDAEDDAQRHRHQADGHRGLRAVHDARPLIAPQPVGAQQEDALCRIGRARSGAGCVCEQAEDAIGMPGDEEAHGHLLLRIGRPFHAQASSGLRLPTMAGTQGAELPSSKRCTRLHRNEGLAARRCASGSWVEKKSGHQDDR